jgi:predicted acyl esterase
MWATANVFSPATASGLEVSSNNVPRFDRNGSTGGQITTETADQYQPAINRMIHNPNTRRG